MAFKLACKTNSYLNFEQIALAHMAEIGIRYVELPLPSAENLDAVEAELEKYHLTASTLEASLPMTADADDAEFHRTLHVANRLGTPILFVSVHSKEAPLESVYARLRQLGDEAESHGVKIALETHPDLADNGRVARQTMEAVNHPAVGINFDTANVLYYADGPSDTIEELKQVLPWVISVHIKDYSGDAPKQWAFPALGQGHVNFKEVFELLEAQGFDGPATLEIEGISGEVLDEEQVKARMAESVRVARQFIN